MNKILRRTAVIAAAVMILAGILPVSAKYTSPQKYSTDPYTTEDEFQKEVDAIEIPEEKVQKGIAVWLNKTQVQLSKGAVYKNKTIYVPLKEFFTQAGMEVNISGKNITVSGNGITASMKKGSSKCTVDGQELTLGNPPKKVKGVLMVSADFIKAVLDAKVWYDEDGKTFAVTTGSMKDDGILRNINGKLYMDGQPFYEISFNKWDLAYQVASSINKESEWFREEDQFSAAEAALSMLHGYGFKTIRVFVNSSLRNSYFRSEKQKNLFYQQMDLMFDLLDKYDIKIVCSLGLTSNVFYAKGEGMGDLYLNPDSESRKMLNQFLDDFVSRYKDRKSVLMWEIENEGNLQADIGWSAERICPSAKTLGIYYAAIAERIKMNDPERLVTGGDGELRSSQFNLYKGTRLGYIGSNWVLDTLEERLEVLELLYHGIDVISVHAYDYGLNETYYPESRENMETTRHQDLDLYMDEAKRLGKILYNGETSLSVTSVGYDDSAFEKSEVDEYLQKTIDVGVQLTHWWTFHCDREGHDAEDTYTWDMTFGKGLEAVIEANQKLQAKYVVNGLEEGTARGCAAVAASSTAAVITVLAAASFVLKKKK